MNRILKSLDIESFWKIPLFYKVLYQPKIWTVQCSYLKSLKKPFFKECFKIKPLSNSYGSKTTTQKFFRVASRGFQSFGLIEGAGVLPSKQWPKCTVRVTSVILYLTDFWMQAPPKLFVYQIRKVIHCKCFVCRIRRCLSAFSIQEQTLAVSTCICLYWTTNIFMLFLFWIKY